MKVYRVIDDCTNILTTTDRLKMLEAVYKLLLKHESKQSYFWVDEEELH